MTRSRSTTAPPLSRHACSLPWWPIPAGRLVTNQENAADHVGLHLHYVHGRAVGQPRIGTVTLVMTRLGQAHALMVARIQANTTTPSIRSPESSTRLEFL